MDESLKALLKSLQLLHHRLVEFGALNISVDGVQVQVDEKVEEEKASRLPAVVYSPVRWGGSQPISILATFPLEQAIASD